MRILVTWKIYFIYIKIFYVFCHILIFNEGMTHNNKYIHFFIATVLHISYTQKKEIILE